MPNYINNTNHLDLALSDAKGSQISDHAAKLIQYFKDECIKACIETPVAIQDLKNAPSEVVSCFSNGVNRVDKSLFTTSVLEFILKALKGKKKQSFIDALGDKIAESVITDSDARANYIKDSFPEPCAIVMNKDYEGALPEPAKLKYFCTLVYEDYNDEYDEFFKNGGKEVKKAEFILPALHGKKLKECTVKICDNFKKECVKACLDAPITSDDIKGAPLKYLAPFAVKKKVNEAKFDASVLEYLINNLKPNKKQALFNQIIDKFISGIITDKNKREEMLESQILNVIEVIMEPTYPGEIISPEKVKCFCELFSMDYDDKYDSFYADKKKANNDEEIASLKQKVTDLEKEKESKELELFAANTIIGENEKKIKSLEKESNDYKGKYTSTLNENTSLKAQNAKKDAEIKQAEGERDAYKKQVDAYVQAEENEKKAKEAATKRKELNKGEESKFIESFKARAEEEILFYSEKDLNNFHVAMKSSQLVILAGPSGTGKSRLPLVYANALGLSEEDPDRTLLFVPISPSYIEPSDILGYVFPNSSKRKNKNDEEEIIHGTFLESGTRLATLLIHAQQHPEQLHMVVFDEMNLAQIEHWFAPFLSLMEKKDGERSLTLYSSGLVVGNASEYPPKVEIGSNVMFVGTVNLDETTKAMSDRLLDRAIVINLTKEEFDSFRKNKSKAGKAAPLVKVDAEVFNDFRNTEENYISVFVEAQTKFFDELHTLISEASPQKGVSFRNLKTISAYLKNAKGILSDDDAFDIAIAQTIVKKLSGSTQEMDKLLSDSEENPSGILYLLNKYKTLSQFSKTRDEIKRKRKELDKYGFTR